MSYWDDLIHALCERFKLEFNEVKDFITQEFHKIGNEMRHVEDEVIDFIEGHDDEEK